MGTDLEVAVRYRLGDNSKVEEPGTALIPAKVAAAFVSDLSGETVTLETTEDKCFISAGVDRCELVTIDPDEFPVVPRFDEEGAIQIQGGIFTRLVGRTCFAAAREPGRYAMHGVLTQLEGGLLRTVATDGRRLAVASSPVDTDSTVELRAIVPTKGMQLFARVIEDPLEPVSIQLGETQIGLRTKKGELFARVIEGEFPRYTAVIPTSSENNIEADAELLSRKLRLVSNVASSDTRAVKLEFQKGELKVTANSAGRGNAEGQMEVDYKGKEASIAFNPDYVLEGLKNCETDRVRLEFNERTSPGKFTLGENYIYIVMPITVDT